MIKHLSATILEDVWGKLQADVPLCGAVGDVSRDAMAADCTACWQAFDDEVAEANELRVAGSMDRDAEAWWRRENAVTVTRASKLAGHTP